MSGVRVNEAGEREPQGAILGNYPQLPRTRPNYHFGNKEQLYLKVIEHWMDVAFADWPIGAISDKSLSLEKQMEAFVCFLLVLLKESPWFGRLVIRESSLEPTAALDMVVKANIGPHNEGMFNIVRALLGEGFDESEVRLYSASIVGRCSYFYICRVALFSTSIINRYLSRDSLACTPLLPPAEVRVREVRKLDPMGQALMQPQSTAGGGDAATNKRAKG